MQHERGQREVVHPINLTRHVDLILMVPVDFDEHVHPECVRLCREVGNERERLGNHEAARPGLLDGVADGIEPDGLDARGMQT